MVNLADNDIVSVAQEAFHDLRALQFKPQDFNATNADGTEWTLALFGIGMCDLACRGNALGSSFV